MRTMLRTAPHLEAVFNRDLASARVSLAVDVLKEVKPDVLVVTGLSGIVLGVQVAAALGCGLAVVRRPGEVDQTVSGRARVVEGHLGGRWVFFDDFVASGSTRQRASEAFMDASVASGVEHEYLGAYFHSSGELSIEVV